MTMDRSMQELSHSRRFKHNWEREVDLLVHLVAFLWSIVKDQSYNFRTEETIIYIAPIEQLKLI